MIFLYTMSQRLKYPKKSAGYIIDESLVHGKEQ